jgi:hypothetical protein
MIFRAGWGRESDGRFGLRPRAYALRNKKAGCQESYSHGIEAE